MLMIYGIGTIDRLISTNTVPSFHASNYHYWWGSILPQLPNFNGRLRIGGDTLDFRPFFPDQLKALNEAYAHAA